MKVRVDKNGVHLFDRGSGLNILLDKTAVPRSQWNLSPRFVSIALTNVCDLHCRFCYAPKHKATLDVDSVVTWAIALDQDGCLGIGFGGGEPTLHPDFVPLCQQIADETQLAVTFTTHGHRLTHEMAEQLAGSVHFVRVSMDGIGDTYAEIRGRQFKALLGKLDLARRIAPFGVNYVVNASTIDDIDTAATLAFEHGAQEMLLLPERPVPGSEGIDDATLDTLVEWIKLNRRFRLAISDGFPLDGVPIAEPFRDADGLSAYAHIEASGRILESSFSKDGVEIGDSIEHALAKLRRNLGEAK